ncbi:alanine dehydrogenase [Ardenticatena maritima]|uniref:Alanine dehydrogenase n=1 Tax=Ardenticatena maritima TaxID=872965 RepID=A0A0M8K9B6_9CHLR|nr:alanine dehydrogenase [Ardenticatena maritima]KPL89158.1 hypothetical protein SE16_01195 [Ardenticatena maritima]GAP64395.1 alanine dehydrogenase [Ardenticatena maritima]
MDIGVPKEVRLMEQRVALTPAAADALVRAGHRVFVQHGAGEGAGFPDSAYEAVGATIVYTAEEAYGRADLVVKVARPTEAEYRYFRPGQVIMAFFHLAVASPDLLETLQADGLTAIAYETIETDDGFLPVLHPTSILAGRMAPLIAGQLLESTNGGRGILLSGIPGTPPAAVVILGAGTLGRNAAQAFCGLGAQVTVLDQNLRTLQELDRILGQRVSTMLATPYNIAKAVSFADVLIGAVSVPGARAPILVSREMVKTMRPRAVIIDFSIDSGGCIETSRPTNHVHPFYIEENVIHYAVPNVPARVARTGSYALANAALPFIQEIADKGLAMALEQTPALQRGVNVWQGKLANARVAAALGREVEVTL